MIKLSFSFKVLLDLHVSDLVIRQDSKQWYLLFYMFAICQYISPGLLIIIDSCTTSGYCVREVYIYFIVRKYS